MKLPNLPLSDFEAGDYSLQVTVTDTSGALSTSKSDFKVR